MREVVHIIGGGLAGCEAAWQLAQRDVPVVLHEMRPHRTTPAHQSERLAELVCSNSFRSDDMLGNAVGLLHEEMRRAGSLIMACADATRIPAGSALAMDRDAFADRVTERIATEAKIKLHRQEVTDLAALGDNPVIIATGPLTSDALAAQIIQLTGDDGLAFFDAIAPIVYTESIDFTHAWYESRWGKGDGKDYINCPLDKPQYEQFVAALCAAETSSFKEWEANTPYFEGCMPVEVMAERGPQTLRFGPMKPVGLTDPRSGRRPYAVVQLRQDNKLATLYNIVGFQTKMKHAEQVRVFRTIPGLERAEFARLGGLHRNSFIRSPQLLNPQLGLHAAPQFRFAGQITGVEGYVESAAIGLLAGRFTAHHYHHTPALPPPPTTALGALLAHITGGADRTTFQPMNINFGLLPPLAIDVVKNDRKPALARRALADLQLWLSSS